MVNILLSGCNGTMGHVIAGCVKKRTDCQICAGIDKFDEVYDSFPIFQTPDACNVDADVIVDFSNPSVTGALLDYAIAKNTPVVLATTGLSQEQLDLVAQAAKKIPIFSSANMSLGVNLLIELAKKATAVLGHDFDIEIVEKHHNKKVDAPSGTALMLANAVAEELPQKPEYVYNRHDKHEKRSKEEIGIHSIRGGTIVGEHDVIFAGQDEIITLSHCAMSKEIFATGAINAALFLHNQKPGLYNMGSMIG